MGFFKNIFGNKTEKVELTKQKSTEYFIDIDPNSNAFSTAFKDFYKNHFIDQRGLARQEVDPKLAQVCSQAISVAYLCSIKYMCLPLKTNLEQVFSLALVLSVCKRHLSDY